MNDLVKALERLHGRVELIPEDGMTKIGVAGLRLAFPDAEKLALGKVTVEAFERAPTGR
jgi:hypothetical protein